jgi:uncharacterized protein
MATHNICHVEWPSTDFERTQKFYATLFEWKFSHFGSDYLMFESAGGVSGGFWRETEVKPSSAPLVYVEVAELDPYLKQAVELGGSVENPMGGDAQIQEIPGVGWISILNDADGNRVGLFKSGHAQG